MAALKGNFTMTRVAQELRNQWSEEELKRRDQGNRTTAWWCDEPDQDDPFTADQDSPDMAYLAQSGLNAEGMALVSEATEAQHAMALVEKGRRTLREARAKQHYVKLSRQYYGPPGRFQHPGRQEPHVRKETTAITAPMAKCLSCGGSRKTQDCPRKTKAFQASPPDEHEHQAPFICLTDQVMAAVAGYEVHGKPSTQEAMHQGKAVIDGGATKTLGSVTAVERLMELNSQQHGDSRLSRLDTDEKPTFGFGNSSSDQCLSTAWMKVKAGGRQGELKIHTLDKGNGPILFSVEALRALGAIIDFEYDLICFRKLSGDRIIQLEQSSSGHQLLPLSSDLYDNSHRAKTPVVSLKDMI